MMVSLPAISDVEYLKLLQNFYDNKENSMELPKHRALLHYACVYGDVNSARKLINEYNFSVEVKDDDGCTPFTLAVQNRQINIVGLILSVIFKKDLNLPGLLNMTLSNNLKQKYWNKIIDNHSDHNGDTPLHVACMHGHLSIVKFFITELGCDPNYKNREGKSSLYLAVENGHLNIVKYLYLHARCDYKTSDKSCKTLLHIASQYGHDQIIEYIVNSNDKYSSLINRDNDSNTPLHIAAKYGNLYIAIYLINDLQCNPNHRGFNQCNPLHYASQNGHLNVIKYFIEVHDCDLMARDGSNNTPLHLAARFGHLDAVKYFVEEVKCDPNCTGFNQRFPLHDACQNGHLNVIKYFIDVHNCDFMARDGDNCTPLHLAAFFGHLDAVKYFAEEVKCDPNCTSLNQRFPLHDACENGHLNVIKYFIEVHNCDFMAKDIRNNSPLHLAALFGHLDAVKYFVEEVKCDPNCTGFNLRFPLHDACQNGHLNVIKYFIEVHDCDLMARDVNNDTPLHLAARFGHLDAVKYFVEEVKCDPNCTGFNQRFPLHDACQNGHLNVIKYFIDVHNCDFMTRDGDNCTPLHLAARFGHLDAVKYLVEEVKCDPNCTGLNQRFPLHDACQNGHLNVIKYFIEVHNCDFMARDGSNNSPLHLAALFGHLDAVKYFVEEVKCDPNCTGFNQRFPLHDACENGHLNVIKYFIDVHNCDFMARDGGNCTPLHLAALFGHLDAVKYFVEEVKCDPNCTGLNQRFPLHDACQNGHLNVIKYFIEVHNCDFMARDGSNNSPLHLAALFGHLDAVKYLVEEVKCDPNCTGLNQRFPLHDACQNGHLNVIKYFIEVHDCDLMARDVNNDTPLHLAAEFGHLDAVKYFVEEVKCDPNCTGFNQCVPLHFACENGHLNVIKYFIEVHHCDLMAKDRTNMTPTHIAAICGHQNLFKYLIESILSFVSIRSEEDLCKAVFLLPESKIIESLFNNTQSIFHHLVACDNFDDLRYVCTFCRIDPMLLKNFKDIEKQTKNASILDYFKIYIDPLHEAAITGHFQNLIFYIEDKKWSPLLNDRHGNNILHNAAQYGQLKIAKYLVKNLYCAPFMKNRKGLIAQQLASNNGFVAVESYLLRITSSKPIAKKYSLSYICCIIVMGNSGAGKSTLIKSIGSKKTLFFSRILPVKGVLPCTPGIVPNKIESEDYGCVKIYDFAGNEEYYASHEAILQHSKYPFVIIVVNISLPLSKIKEQLSFWVTITLTSKKCRNMNILVIGSRSDRGKFSENRKEADHYMENLCVQISSGITYHGIVECDCRYSVSPQMKILHSKIASIKNTMLFDHVKDESDYSNRLCASLMYQLKHCETDLPPVMKLGKLWHKIKRIKIPGPTLIQLTDKDLLIETCIRLSSSGHLLYFPHESFPDKSLLVLNEEIILGSVHASLNYIKEAINNDIGMLEELDLKHTLAQSGTMPMTPDMAIKYLIFSQFCTLVSLESIIPKCKLVGGRKRFYFFPNLVKAEIPTNLFIDKDKFTDIYTWTLQCNSNQFFTPRCIHNLFIQLIQCEDTYGTVRHSIWKNGIFMVNSDSVRSVIEFTDQTTCLKLMMQCRKDQTLKLVEERSKLITLIKSLVIKLNPKVEATEYLFLPQSYPLTDFRKIPVVDMAKSIFYKKVGVVESFGSGDSESIDWHHISDILCFDSVQSIGMPRVEQIFMFKDFDRQVPSELLNDITSDLQESSELHTALTRDSNSGLKYTELYQELTRFSIFTKETFQV